MRRHRLCSERRSLVLLLPLGCAGSERWRRRAQVASGGLVPLAESQIWRSFLPLPSPFPTGCGLWRSLVAGSTEGGDAGGARSVREKSLAGFLVTTAATPAGAVPLLGGAVEVRSPLPPFSYPGENLSQFWASRQRRGIRAVTLLKVSSWASWGCALAFRCGFPASSNMAVGGSAGMPIFTRLAPCYCLVDRPCVCACGCVSAIAMVGKGIGFLSQ